MSKEYHFGVVAYFDEDTSTWEFEATTINGSDSPFAEMSWGEVYDQGSGDWEFAEMGSGRSPETANFNRLLEAIDAVVAYLKGAT